MNGVNKNDVEEPWFQMNETISELVPITPHNRIKKIRDSQRKKRIKFTWK